MSIRTEQASLDSLFASFFDPLPVGVALFDWNDSSGAFRLVRANPLLVAMVGDQAALPPGVRPSQVSFLRELDLEGSLEHVRESGEPERRERQVTGGKWFELLITPSPEALFPVYIRDVTDEVRERCELERSREFFRGLAGDAADYVARYSWPEGRIDFVNAGVVEALGMASEDLAGRELSSLLPRDLWDRARQAVARLTPEEPVGEYTDCLQWDGREVFIDWTCRGFFDRTGSLTSVQTFGRDVTKRVREGQVLERCEQRFRSLVEDLDAYFCEFDPGGILTYVNGGYCRVFGRTEEELLGSCFFELIPEEERASLRCGLEALTPENPFFSIEHEVYGPGGTILWQHWTNRACFEEDGTLRGFTSVGYDITETRQARETAEAQALRLEEEMQRNRVVVEHSPVVIFEAGMGFGSPCRFVSENVDQFGYRARDLMAGRVSLDLRTHPEDMERLRRQVARADAESLAYREYTYRLLSADGDYRWVDERNSVLFDRDGRPSGIIGVLIDQTELVEAQRELQIGNEALGRYAQDVEQTWESTLHLLAGLTEMRDPYTQGHQLRVAELCRRIGREMGYEEEPLKELIQAASVHDIGKMEIPSDYLNRPGPLTKEEFEFIKRHPGKGYELLSRMKTPGFLAEIVHQHHERMDGSGYPKGLCGEEILLAARVLAVADVVEAMLSHRPYRPAHSLTEVLEEISRQEGKLYDPAVVRALRRLFTEKNYSLPRTEDLLPSS